LVRVIASGVNPADPLILGGKYAKEFGTHLPLILGYEIAGVVVKTGAKIMKLKVGDPVYAYLLWGGGWAEYCISNEGESAIKPKFEEIVHDVDLVLDPVGRDTLARSYGVVKKGGIVVTLVSRCDEAELKKHEIRGASLSSHPDAKELAEITKLIDDGKIKPIV